MSPSPRPRYTTRPFPPYTYVPGTASPHPVSDPRGHMHGIAEPLPVPLDPTNWQSNQTYLYAVDLFNHGYYWEAHEAWESLWHAAGHHGQMADFLKALIKLAAAGVKHLEGNPTGVRRHLRRGQGLLQSIRKNEFCGVDLMRLADRALESTADNTAFTAYIELEGADHAQPENVARKT